MPSGKIPGTFSPAVPFSEPSHPVAGISPLTANTNFGRDVNTLDRSIPVGYFPAGDGQGPSETDDMGMGVCLGEWGKRGQGY